MTGPGRPLPHETPVLVRLPRWSHAVPGADAAAAIALDLAAGLQSRTRVIPWMMLRAGSLT
jgi:hypothetical protein